MRSSDRMLTLIVSAGAFLCAASVGAGAFAAHALKDILDERALEVFRTGAYYQFMHSLALVLLGTGGGKLRRRMLTGVALCFFVGIILFSGSLYALALSGVKILGAITPFGGVLFIAGWCLWGVGAYRAKEN